MSFQASSTTSRGYAVALCSAALLSTTAIFIRYLTSHWSLPPLVLAFWRNLFVVLTMVPVLALMRPRLLEVAGRHLPGLVGFGLVMALFNGLWTLSVAQNGAAVATVLVYCSAGFTAVLGRWFLQEELDGVRICAVFLGLSGCVLVSEALSLEAWCAQPVGLLTGVASGLAYAAYSVMGRSASQRGLDPWTSLVYTFAFATLFLLLGNMLPPGILPGAARQWGDFAVLGASPMGWGMLFLLAAGPTVLGFGLYNVSLSLLPSSVANLILTAEPAFTVTQAYLLLGERLHGIQVVGGGLILCGVIMLRLHEGGKASLQPAESQVP